MAEREIEFRNFSPPKNCETRLVEVAGICTRIMSDSPEIISYIGKQYRDFRSKQKPHFCVEVAVSNGIGSRENTTIFTNAKGKKLFIECGFIRGMIDAGNSAGKVWVHKGQEDNVDVFLRNCFSFFLAERGGMLVHAAALAKGNRAFLFPGRSGAGKTTISMANRRSLLVLNDEICAIRKVNKTLRVFGTPFWGGRGALAGNRGSNKGIKMDSVLFLKKGRGNSKSELPKAEALHMLMGCAIHMNKSRGKTVAVFNLCSEIAMQSRCYELCLEKGAKLGGIL
ncbi:MAG: hypothetical protein V1676_06430 [Candidatus Diapherotrites archaeon]